MVLHLYNTLTRKKEEFVPIELGKVRMFVCGPTVYDYMQIGNARTFTTFDVLARAIRVSGNELTYLMNITDIDDKIIARAAERGVTPEALSKEYTEVFFADMKALGNTAVSEYPRATDHIAQVIEQVKTLRDKGNAYLIEGDGWYFDLTTFSDYGKLSGRTLSMAEDGVSRIDDNDKKRNRGDFCLWKLAPRSLGEVGLSKPSEPSWPSDLGDGRPGWHIEDTAITAKYFGPQYDLHGGAEDLMFPHHEAEIAQQESASGLKPFVRMWVHPAFLNVDGKRMGKSLGNYYTLRDIEEKGYNATHLRYLYLTTHYKQKLNFTWESLEAAKNALNKLVRKIATAPQGEALGNPKASPSSPSKSAFYSAIADDLNTPQALAELWDVADNPPLAYEFDKVLGLSLGNRVAKLQSEQSEVPDEVQKLVSEREEARKSGDFARADVLRVQIQTLGFAVDDSPTGAKLTKICA